MEAGAGVGGCCGVTGWAWAYVCVYATLVWRCDHLPPQLAGSPSWTMRLDGNPAGAVATTIALINVYNQYNKSTSQPSHVVW